jgi:hypothetical protein
MKFTKAFAVAPHSKELQLIIFLLLNLRAVHLDLLDQNEIKESKKYMTLLSKDGASGACLSL